MRRDSVAQPPLNCRISGAFCLFPNQFDRQARDHKGREKEWQEPLSGASEGDRCTIGSVEGVSAARVSAISDLQRVTARGDWQLDSGVHVDLSDLLTVEYDLVCATTDLCPDRFVRQLQRCRQISPLILKEFSDPRDRWGKSSLCLTNVD
jgi:hypothetical protein